MGIRKRGIVLERRKKGCLIYKWKIRQKESKHYQQDRGVLQKGMSAAWTTKENKRIKLWMNAVGK